MNYVDTNSEHLAVFRRGTAEWNAWREQNPYVLPVLRRQDFAGRDLSGANLANVVLSGCRFNHANLSGAKMYQVELYGADLRDANFTEADMRGADDRPKLVRVSHGNSKSRGCTAATAISFPSRVAGLNRH